MKKSFLKMFIIAFSFFGFIATTNAKKDYEAILNQLAPNGIINITGVKPDTTSLPLADGAERPEDVLNMIMSLLIKEHANNIGLDIKDTWAESLSISCTETTQCTVNVVTKEQYTTESGLPGLGVDKIEASKEVTIKYTDPDPYLVSDARDLMLQIKKSDKYKLNKYDYIAYGLTVLNYDYNIYKNNYISDFARLHYVAEINDLLDGRNYQLRFIGPSGNTPWANYGNGYTVLYYKNMPLAYGGVTAITLRRVIYIPSDTNNNSESYIAAAKKVIDDYIPNNKITVRLITGEELQNENVDTILQELEIDKKDTDGNIYILEENGEYIGWYILAKEIDNNKSKKPEFNKKDYDSKVNVKSSDGSISLDSKLQVEEIKDGSEKYQEIEESIEKENFQAFDISLYSDGLAKSIKVSENGTFEVSLPVEDVLKNKNLVVYYIKDDGTIEEHPVTLDEEGNAVFETNHFSTYILTDKEKDEEVPQTVDSIYTMISFFIIGLTGCIGLTLYRKLN